ncbi:hypothetical protein POM88_025599 [Heracleum sosnowskyi]|uniref:Aspergillus nuclease S1 n=1 Tax=Heracleum sosnowskyi TaxID=360622 RepID=A0AAD8MJX8_9APIA|nr:hypothetical protein POM88_025599 [Heracleum sosnowskyi]
MGKVFELWLTCTGIFLLLCVPAVMSWGYEGHFAVCKIAQGFLTEDALTAVKALLPDYAGGELAAVCSWPDEFRKLMPWSTALHFVNPPDFSCNYKYCRDCHDSAGNKDRCVTGAIFNYTEQLQSGVHNLNSEMKYNLTEALIFISHFFGDVHQPLHAGFLGDAGGNTIKVHWYQNETNLHRVWDDKIIESSLNTFYNTDLSNLIHAIQRKISGVWFTDSLSWKNCTSNHVVCPDPTFCFIPSYVEETVVNLEFVCSLSVCDNISNLISVRDKADWNIIILHQSNHLLELLRPSAV